MFPLLSEVEKIVFYKFDKIVFEGKLWKYELDFLVVNTVTNIERIGWIFVPCAQNII